MAPAGLRYGAPGVLFHNGAMSTLPSKAPRAHAALAGVWAYPLPAPRRVRLALAGVLLYIVALWLGWLSGSQPRFWQAGSALAAIALVAILVFRMPLWKWGTSLQWTGSKWRLVQAVQRAEEGSDLASLVVAMDGLVMEGRPKAAVEMGRPFSERMTARSMVFCSSRTLPGHG